ncbi:retrovirus-related pol polyprotein from transposon TNT 1-94 [Tanacetum coccineum]
MVTIQDLEEITKKVKQYMQRDNPFQMDYEAEAVRGRLDLYQKLVNVICQEMMKMFKGKGVDCSSFMASTSKPHACIILHGKHVQIGLSFHASIKLMIDNVGLNIKIHWVVDTRASDHIQLVDPSTRQILAAGEGFNNLYICKPSSEAPFQNSNPVLLGHTSVSKLIHVHDCQKVNVSHFFCDTCMLAKHHILPFPLSHTRSNVAFDLIHVDLGGPYKTSALNGICWILQEPLRANFPNKFWGDCILAATYLINKMPMKILDWKSPFDVLHGTVPSYEHLKTIGCLCYADVTKPHKDKFEPRGNIRDVIFKEDIFPFKESASKAPAPSMSTHCSTIS